jgi:non-ribosomal peptide synthetase component F
MLVASPYFEHTIAPMGEKLRDPLAEELVGPGKMFETESIVLAGRPCEVFRGAPRTLSDIYSKAQALGERPMVVDGELCLTYAQVFARAARLAHHLKDRFGIAS